MQGVSTIARKISKRQGNLERLARLAGNFKNAGNGGLFNVYEVPQMENGWKMEDGRWKMHTAWATAGIPVNITALGRTDLTDPRRGNQS
jgi:hypothetical protein